MAGPDLKQSLLACGRTLFIAQGYAATSIDEICAGAGATKGGFFHHFESKERFARDLLADTWQTFVEAHTDLDQLPAREALHAHIDFMVGFISGDGRLIPRLAQELAPSHPEVATQVQGYFRSWTEYLMATLERAGCHHEPDAAMEFIIAAIEGTPMVAGQLGSQVPRNTATHLKRYIDMMVGDL